MLTIYLVISTAVLFIFACQWPFFSLATLFLFSLLIVGLITFPFYHSVNISLLALLLIMPLMRLVFLILIEVKYALEGMNQRRTYAAIVKTLVLWLPFPLLAAAGYWMLSVRDHQLHQTLESVVYESEVDTLVYGCGPQFNLVCRCEAPLDDNLFSAKDCPLVDQSLYRVDPRASDMERDIHRSVERLKRTFRNDILTRINTRLDQSKIIIEKNNGNIDRALFGNNKTYGLSYAQSLTAQPVIAYALSDYHPDLSLPSCNGVIDQLFKLRDCVKHIALEPISTAYSDIRDHLQRRTAEISDNTQMSVDEKIQVIKAIFRTIIDERLNNYSRHAHLSVERQFDIATMIDTVSFIVWLTMVTYALFIGFLYVLMRYVYNQRHGRVAFQDDKNNAIFETKNIEKQAIDVRDITIDASMNHFSQTIETDQIWYAAIDPALRYDVDGMICVPRPFTLWLKRLPNRYLMFRFDRKLGKQTIAAHTDDLTRFIKVTLRSEQSICFNFSNLVAFRDDVTLSTKYSLPLAAFFQSQLFFSTASGPGELILCVKNGQPEIMPNMGIKPSDPRDIVMFDNQGQYFLLGDMNPLSVYFLSHRVVPKGTSTLIRQSPDAKSTFSAQASAIRRTLYLLLPLTFVTVILPWLLP